MDNRVYIVTNYKSITRPIHSKFIAKVISTFISEATVHEFYSHDQSINFFNLRRNAKSRKIKKVFVSERQIKNFLKSPGNIKKIKDIKVQKELTDYEIKIAMQLIKLKQKYVVKYEVKVDENIEIFDFALFNDEVLVGVIDVIDNPHERKNPNLIIEAYCKENKLNFITIDNQNIYEIEKILKSMIL